jgi:hypothetical protein
MIRMNDFGACTNDYKVWFTMLDWRLRSYFFSLWDDLRDVQLRKSRVAERSCYNGKTVSVPSGHISRNIDVKQIYKHGPPRTIFISNYFLIS